MLTLPQIIALTFPAARPRVDWEVSDTGTGPVITRWDEALLGPMPTLAGFEALRSQADAAAAAVDAAADDRVQVKLLVAALRAGTGTTAQRFVRCERALARLIDDLL